MNTPYWYVFYCRSRSEKKLYAELVTDGFIVYLPIVTRERIWSDRIKKVQVPMISSYIFVYCNYFEVAKITSYSNVVKIVRLGEEYSRVTDKEIELLRIVEKEGLFVNTETTDYKNGDFVEVAGGPLKGYQGTCVETAGKRYLLIMIEGVGQSIKVKIKRAAVKKLKQ